MVKASREEDTRAKSSLVEQSLIDTMDGHLVVSTVCLVHAKHTSLFQL